MDGQFRFYRYTNYISSVSGTLTSCKLIATTLSPEALEWASNQYALASTAPICLWYTSRLSGSREQTALEGKSWWGQALGVGRGGNLINSLRLHRLPVSQAGPLLRPPWHTKPSLVKVIQEKTSWLLGSSAKEGEGWRTCESVIPRSSRELMQAYTPQHILLPRC